jgi:asparagine synthase (glutamine-hydrolysing)
MCGIAGEWDFDGTPSVANVTAMIDAIAHRGPEGRTCWVSPNGKLALTHAQLSFFKGAETQPVSNTDGTIFAVCNGEIYNYQDLAQIVRQAGIDCDILSDVQIIPYLYQVRGAAAFALLRGEFALALFDAERQVLYLVRDRFGIKPIYYRAAGDAVSFASEIKGLLANPGGAAPPRLPRDCHDPVRPHCSRNQCVFVHPRGQARMLRGNSRRQRNGETVLVARIRAGCGFGRSGRRHVAEPATTGTKFSRRFRRSRDYPIGVYLSGGIDSSAVLVHRSLWRPFDQSLHHRLQRHAS